MSMEELKADLRRNLTDAAKLEGFSAVGKHLVNTLWPFLEALVENVEEIDDAVAELVSQQEDYLQPETAGVILALVEVAGAMAGRLAGAEDDETKQLLALHAHLSQEVTSLLEQITLDGSDEDDGEDDANDSVTEAALTGGADA